MKIIISTVVALWAVTASACSFTSDADIFKTPQENFSNYSYVISGTFTGVIQKEETFEGRDYQFSLYEVHKGHLDQQTITLTSPGHSCGYFGQEGGEVLLFLNSLDSIDESVPKYFFDTKKELLEMGRSLVPDKELVQETKQSVAPETCRVWFDGCNNCHRTAPGEPWACTKKACAVLDEPQCREHMSAKDGLPYVEGPSSDPLDGFVGPDTLPPVQAKPELVEELEKSWWQKFREWMQNLFGR